MFFNTILKMTVELECVKGHQMLSNPGIVERIRNIARGKGIKSDAEIARATNTQRALFQDMPRLKTAPRLDTIAKISKGLGVRIEDLIYETPAADSEFTALYGQINKAQRVEILDRMRIFVLSNKYPADGSDKKGIGGRKRMVA